MTTGAIAAGMTLYPWLALAGGDFSGVGGGEGVAIFDDSQDAEVFRELQLNRQSIPTELMSRAKWMSLERWERDDPEYPFIALGPGKTWQDYYQVAIENLRQVSPLAANHLSRVSGWMKFESWEESGDLLLPHLGDAVPRRETGPNEIRVQLALRLSNGNNDRDQGPVSGPLQLKVIYNKKIFDKLHPLDQAMLIFHEEIYALGQSLGQQNSDLIRPLVMTYFLVRLTEIRGSERHELANIAFIIALQQELVKRLGDYVLYFSSLENFSELAQYKYFSPERHYASLYKVVRLMRDLRIRLESSVPTDQLPRMVMEEFRRQYLENLSPSGSERLLDVDRFVFISYFYLQVTLNVDVMERLLDRHATPEQYNEDFRQVCNKLSAAAPAFRQNPFLVEGALRYCQSYLSSRRGSQGNRSN